MKLEDRIRAVEEAEAAAKQATARYEFFRSVSGKDDPGLYAAADSAGYSLDCIYAENGPHLLTALKASEAKVAALAALVPEAYREGVSDGRQRDGVAGWPDSTTHAALRRITEGDHGDV